MVGTHPKNKNAHLAAPVMTEATKTRAGIPSAKCHTKKPTKDEQICELEACLTAFEHPDETTAILKEPLVSWLLSCNPYWGVITMRFIRDSSLPEDISPYGVKSDAPTKVDLNDFVMVGGKRISLNSHEPQYAILQIQWAYILNIPFIQELEAY